MKKIIKRPKNQWSKILRIFCHYVDKLYDKKWIANEFNKYFSSFVSDNKISITDYKKFMFENFQTMIMPKEDFKFVHTTNNKVADLLNELVDRPSRGYTGLSVSIPNLVSETFIPF